MDAIASQITSLTIVYSSVYSGAGQRKHQSSASLAFAWGIQRWPANSPHKLPVTRKCFQLMTSSWEWKMHSYTRIQIPHRPCNLNWLYRPNPYTSFPFIIGPRNCIGQNFARVSMHHIYSCKNLTCVIGGDIYIYANALFSPSNFLPPNACLPHIPATI